MLFNILIIDVVIVFVFISDVSVFILFDVVVITFVFCRLCKFCK